jgi:hypothetical protein
MENSPKKKKRGRPRKLPESVRGTGLFAQVADASEPSDEAKRIGKEMVGDFMRTERSRADSHYAERAREVVQGISGQIASEATSDPVHTAKVRLGMDWIMSRKTVLTELGRMMTTTEPSRKEVKRFQYVVRRVASRHDKLTAKTACAYIRGQRLGETSEARERVAALHRDLNAAINFHRQRHPESTWADIRRALELTAKQVQGKNG